MQWSKTIGAVIATVLSAVIAALTGDATLSAVEWINIAIIGVGALTTTVIPELDAGVSKFAKPLALAASAVLTLLVNLIADGVTVSEWLQLAVAALGALGIVPLSGNKFSRESGKLVTR